MSCVYVGRANFILALGHNQPLRRVLLPLDCVDVSLWYAPRPPGERSMILGGLWRWRRPGHCSAGTCGLPLHRDGAPDQRTHAAPGEAPASRIQLRGTKHLRGRCRLGSLRHRCCLPAQTVLRSGGPLSMDWYSDWRPVYHLFVNSGRRSSLMRGMPLPHLLGGSASYSRSGRGTPTSREVSVTGESRTGRTPSTGRA